MSAAESSLTTGRVGDARAHRQRVPESSPELRDRELVDRCLAGDRSAWEELYTEHHERLVAAIKLMFGRSWDPNLVEEIAARVWFAVVSNDGQLLDRFDPSRQCRLSTFLMVIAKSQANTIFRSERRRRQRERLASKPESEPADAADSSIAFAEFLAGLKPREREFLSETLSQSLEEQASRTLSDTNRWKLNSRIRAKLKRFFNLS